MHLPSAQQNEIAAVAHLPHRVLRHGQSRERAEGKSVQGLSGVASCQLSYRNTFDHTQLQIQHLALHSVDVKCALNANHTASRTKLALHAQRTSDVPVNFS
jgi:hypothetical protein